MNPRRLHQALAIALLGAAATMASAQTGTTASKPAGAPPANAATAPTDASAAHTAMTGMRRKQADKAHAAPRRVASTESPYQAALKRCVEGPQAQRDSCIDQAISQYGRS